MQVLKKSGGEKYIIKKIQHFKVTGEMIDFYIQKLQQLGTQAIQAM